MSNKEKTLYKCPKYDELIFRRDLSDGDFSDEFVRNLINNHIDYEGESPLMGAAFDVGGKYYRLAVNIRSKHIIIKELGDSMAFSVRIGKTLDVVVKYIKDLCDRDFDFTGRLELNFYEGELKDINETKRTKVKG